jgi:tRNA pseudouridine38-40 synthase
MRNIRLEIEYEGTHYCGWQVQRKTNSIQEVIEKSLKKILQEKVRLIGSGRTDAGVHALAQVANFKTNSGIDLAKLQKALNGLLPDDIVIRKIRQVDPDFHSRFDAESKAYRYTILNRNYPGALLKNTVYFYPYSLDVRLMQRESRVLLGKHNFKSFQASDKEDRSAVRTIKKINITREGDLIRIDIEADGFLHKMVRNIAGTLIEIGRGRFPVGSLGKILNSRDRKLAGPTVPAKGLCLRKVKY